MGDTSVAVLSDGHSSGAAPTSNMSSSPAAMMSSNSLPKSPVSPTSRPEPASSPGLLGDSSKSDPRVRKGDSVSIQHALNESVATTDGDANLAISSSVHSSASKADKPPITIPSSMAQLEAHTPSASSPNDGGLGPNSQRGSRYASAGGLGSRHNSVTSLTASRPAPPSPGSPASQSASRNASRRASQALSSSRRQSQSSDRTAHRAPSHKTSTASMRKAAAGNTPVGLMFTATRRLSGLFNTFTSDDLPDTTPDTKTMDSPLERIGEGVPTIQSQTSAMPNTSSAPSSDQKTDLQPPQSDNLIPRNFSSVSASTSASSSSTPSNPAARHASELEAAYAAYGLFLSGASQAETTEPAPWESPSPAPDENVEEGNMSTKSNKTIVDMGDPGLEWHRRHPIIVRDFAYDEADDRFSSVPIELMAIRDRSKIPTGASSPNTRGRNKFGGFVGGYVGKSTHYGGSGAHYGGRWDISDEEEVEEADDDDWGFPMGTVSGGAQPLGTTRGGGPKRQLKNRNRAWNGLGARGVGGLWADVSQSEEESSGVYEESGEEEISLGAQDGFHPPPAQEEEDDDEDDYVANTHTPSNVRSHFDFLHVQPHPEADGLDGILGDEDDSPYTSDHPGYSELRSGVYRVLFDFVPEGDNELGVSEGQLVKVVGSGGGEGWAVVLKGWTMEAAKEGNETEQQVDDKEAHGLVPESFLEIYHLDDDELL